MTKKVARIWRVSLPCATALVLFSCGENPITENTVLNSEPAIAQGIPASELNWVSWKPEVAQKLKRLEKSGQQTKKIDEDGGKVGGKKTLGNEVIIPKGALDEDYLENTFGDDEVRITVKVDCVDGKEQCAAGVDFLPSMKFLSDVKVTLSWEHLDYTGGELNFSAFFSEDGGATWYDVQVADVDYDKKTLSIYVDHFTRFAWAL